MTALDRTFDPVEALRVAEWRMHNLRLAGPPLPNVVDVVRHLGAAQAQDFGPAKWSLAQRTAAATDADVDRAFAEGSILRTHVLRPTWHFVLPADIRWLLELTAPRVQLMSAYSRRREELDDALLRATADLLGRTLRDGNWLTRKELGSVFDAAGIASNGVRLAHILMHAELIGLICSGPPKGKEQTYALLAERAPGARQLGADEALAELTRRYFASHGPATINDLRWWCSLTSAQIKRGLDIVGSELEQAVIGDLVYWFVTSAPSRPAPAPTVHLLQTYDEYAVGFSESRSVLDIAGGPRSVASRAQWPVGTAALVYNQLVVLDTQAIGVWKRTLESGGVRIEASLRAPLARTQVAAFEAAVRRYGRFLGQPASGRVV